MQLIEPGGMIGILGNGQLGRMMALAARRMGYRICTFGPEEDSPAGQVADLDLVGSYEDQERLSAFATKVDVATYEFENVPAPVAEFVASKTRLFPSPELLSTSQDRIAEKSFLSKMGVPVAPNIPILSPEDLSQKMGLISALLGFEGGGSAVLKTSGQGYDGHGQRVISSLEQLRETIGNWNVPCVLEKKISLFREVSVIVCGDAQGRLDTFGVIENQHRNHILDSSVAPAEISTTLSHSAIEIAREIFSRFRTPGLLCVEFFIDTSERLYVNELAPRPHNSGHLSIEACKTSQFEQLVRALCGWSLGSTTMIKPAAMVNLLGDVWIGANPSWEGLNGLEVHLHLYGKSEPRPGRKMGHITSLADTVHEALGSALEARRRLRPDLF